MSNSLILIALGLLFFFSHVFNELFEKTKVPSVMLLMLIGIIIGPICHLVTPESFGKVGSVFTTVTLIVILFQSGTSLDLKVLQKAFGTASLLTTLNFIVCLGIGVLIGHFTLSLDMPHSIFLGAALGGTSSAVVIPMVNQLKLGERAGIILYLESALSDILCLVVALAMMEGIKGGQVSVSKIFVDMGFSMLTAVILGLAVGVSWWLFQKKFLSGMDNMMFTSFALAFILYGVSDLLHLNGGLAVLSYGIAFGHTSDTRLGKRFSMSDIRITDSEKNFYSEIVFIFQTYFFVYIGISIQLNNWNSLLWGLLFVMLVFAARPVTSLVLGKNKSSKRDHKMVWALGPKGLVAAVLSALPLQYASQCAQNQTYNEEHVASLLKAGSTIQDFACSVVFLSIVISSIMVMIFDRKNARQTALNTTETNESITDIANEETPCVEDASEETTVEGTPNGEEASES